MSNTSIKIEVDDQINPLLSELVALSRLEALKERIDLFIGSLDGPGELLTVDQRPAVGARTRVVLKPSERFLDFMAAIRTVDLDEVGKAHDRPFQR